MAVPNEFVLRGDAINNNPVLQPRAYPGVGIVVTHIHAYCSMSNVGQGGGNVTAFDGPAANGIVLWRVQLNLSVSVANQTDRAEIDTDVWLVNTASATLQTILEVRFEFAPNYAFLEIHGHAL